MPSDATAPIEMSNAEAFALFYGTTASPDVLAFVHDHAGPGPIASMTDARRMIMALDRQTHHTPAIIRFDARDLKYIEIEGFTQAVDMADIVVSAWISARRSYEPALTGVFRRYLQPRWKVADIGANIGYYSMLARTMVGPGGQVFAFEPNSENARLILLSCAANGFANVTLFPLALSDRTGHAYFTSAIGSNGGLLTTEQDSLAGGRGVVVPTMRLDDLVFDRLDFIKMDAEGAEHRIALGAERILSTDRPIVSTEFSCEMISRVSGVAPRDYLGLFSRFGYTTYRLDHASNRLEMEADIDAYLASWGNPGRIDDLLLLPSGAPVLQPS